MRAMALLLGLLLTAATGISQDARKASGPAMSFDKEVHDFGQILKGGNGTCYFNITNTGDEALILTKAKATCGCTIASCPTEPVPPGSSVKIKVDYNTNLLGLFNKHVIVYSNAGEHKVKIKGDVVVQQED